MRLVTNGNGTQSDTQSHNGFGRVMDGGGVAPTFFTTYERQMTGSDYARARFYRSDHGRFASPDPYRGSYRQGDPQSLNRYIYVTNDPINRSDPSGLVTCTTTWDEEGGAHTNGYDDSGDTGPGGPPLELPSEGGGGGGVTPVDPWPAFTGCIEATLKKMSECGLLTIGLSYVLDL